MCPLFSGGSLVDSIYRDCFVSIHPVFVFRLEHSTFKVMIDKYDPIAICFIVLGSILSTFSAFPV